MNQAKLGRLKKEPETQQLTKKLHLTNNKYLILPFSIFHTLTVPNMAETH